MRLLILIPLLVLAMVLSYYAEDVTRLVEREVKLIESEIREVYPQAEYIELEPDSKSSGEFAVESMDDATELAMERRDVEKALMLALQEAYKKKK